MLQKLKIYQLLRRYFNKLNNIGDSNYLNTLIRYIFKIYLMLLKEVSNF